ncbi:MAG: hypothetical protein WCP36_09175 [Methanomicrobiales archaeon]
MEKSEGYSGRTTPRIRAVVSRSMRKISQKGEGYRVPPFTRIPARFHAGLYRLYGDER